MLMGMAYILLHCLALCQCKINAETFIVLLEKETCICMYVYLKKNTFCLPHIVLITLEAT